MELLNLCPSTCPHKRKKEKKENKTHIQLDYQPLGSKSRPTGYKAEDALIL
jgi:hypothetical protein